MKTLLLSALLIGGIGTSFAQLNLDISGNLNNAGGATIDIDVLVQGVGTSISQTITTDALGDFTHTVTVPASVTQGLVNIEFINCFGVTQTATEYINPPSTTIDFGIIDFCSATVSCEANFTVAQEYIGNVPVPNSLIITNTSIGTGLTYTWDTGDGTTLTGPTVMHTYADPGPFSLCLTVDDGNGCSDLFCDIIGVNASGLSIGKASGFTINSAGTASIADLSNAFLFDVYPNPATETVTMNLGELLEDTELSILDLSGRTIHTQVVGASNSSQSITLDLSAIPAGIYQVTLFTQRGAAQKRLSVR